VSKKIEPSLVTRLRSASVMIHNVLSPFAAYRFNARPKRREASSEARAQKGVT
jgi:hypothetical protein